jgi:putative DNA primase/helicase
VNRACFPRQYWGKTRKGWRHDYGDRGGHPDRELECSQTGQHSSLRHRRLQLVPWTVTVPHEKRDPHLAAKLRNEGPGILNRLLDGLRDYLDNGLVEPASVQDATAEYRADSDPVGRFISDCTAVAENGRIQSSLLHEVYTAWACVNGGPNWSMRGLTGALVDRRWRRTKSGNVFWIGYQLTKSINDFVDHDGKPLKATEAPDTSTTPHAKGEDYVVDF